MEKKVLYIAVVERGDEVLLRKKPAGSKPYRETWYLFGCEPVAGEAPAATLASYLEREIGVRVQGTVPFSSATEVKEDTDGAAKEFTYLNFVCHYVSGEPKVPAGAERVAWVAKSELSSLDLVPPSRALLREIGWMS
jgi:ADP-ribose pyrophosphatase YjhB (NUDIX family)